jgi:hypothetical protein
MCKRSEAHADPLLSAFLERYHLNLLAVPRRDADVGDLYIDQGGRTAAAGTLASFLARPFAMPEVARGEPMAAVSGSLSNSVKAEAGFGLLEGFLTALGATFPIGKAKARWAARGVRALRFKLLDARRDSVDVGRLGLALIDNSLAANHPLIEGGQRYFLVSAVCRSPSVSVAFEDDTGHAVELGAELTGVGDAEAGVEIRRAGNAEVTFAGQVALAFGVELYEVVARGERIRLKLPDMALNIRAAGAAAARPQPAYLGGEQASLFVDIDPGS